MSLKHGLLGLLNYGQMTGYELDKVFKDSLNFFWEAQTSQIYRELNAMEKLGWLTSEIVFQKDKPNKKKYSITDAGKLELQSWLAENSWDKETQVRSPFLMKLFFSGERSTDENIAMLKNYKIKCMEAMTSLDETDSIIDHYLSVSTNQRALYWKLVADFGKSYMKMCLDWAEHTIKILEDSL